MNPPGPAASPARWARLLPDAPRDIDWSCPADAALFDPYLQWAMARRFEDYATDAGPDGRVPVALELLPGAAGRRHLRALVDQGVLQVPEHYLAQPGLQHCTARIGIHQFHQLRGRVRRMELGVTALRPEVAPRLPPPLGPWTDRPAPVPPDQRPPPCRTVVGIIDDGCAFAHQQFRDAQGGTRVRWLWQQDGRPDRPGATPPLWGAPAGFNYGAEATGPRLGRLMQPGPDGRVDEAAAYRRAGMDGLALGLAPHGTRVMDFAAGTVDPMFRQVGDRGPAFGRPVADAAGRADIVFVQMPRRAMLDASGAWLTVGVLDAVHYVLSRAGPAEHVVVNISLGAFAGPHDGSSLLEAALDALIEQHAPRLVVVVAAGNSYRSSTHAALELAPGGCAPVRWDVPIDDRTETFVEVWADAVGDAGEPPALVARLLPPRRDRPPGAGAATGSEGAGLDGAGGLGCAGCADRADTADHVDRADSADRADRASRTGSADHAGCAGCGPPVRPGEVWAWHDGEPGRRGPAGLVLNTAAGVARLVLVSLAPVAALRPTVPRACSGGWTLWLDNPGSAPLRVHVYVERDDVPFGGSARQTLLVGRESTQAVPLDGRGTLSSLATGRHTIVVGAHGLRDGTLAPFSASGPTRDRSPRGRQGPDLTAPGTGGECARLLAAGALSGGAWVPAEGTSLAAPVVTRQIVNLVEAEAGCRLGRQGILDALVADATATPGAAHDPQRSGRGRLKHWPPVAPAAPSPQVWRPVPQRATGGRTGRAIEGCDPAAAPRQEGGGCAARGAHAGGCLRACENFRGGLLGHAGNFHRL